MASTKQLHVSDMEGNEFKWVQSAEGQKVLSVNGFSVAYVGTAHWGPIGEAKTITKGLSQFTELFGDVSPEIDDAHMTALKTFTKSADGYFTRAADSTEARASVDVAQAATSPSIQSAAGPFALVTGVSSTLTVALTNSLGAAVAGSPININFTGTELATQAVINIPLTGITFPLNYVQNDTIVININSTAHTYTVNEVGGFAAATAAALVAELITPSATNAWDVNPFAGGSKVATLSQDGTNVTVITDGYGSAYSITTVSDSQSGPFVAGSTDVGENSNPTDIATAINTALGVHGAAAYSAVTQKITISSVYTSALATITISGNANTVLGYSVTPAAGIDSIKVGKFEAYYTGRDGNRIQLIYANNKLSVYFRNVLIKVIDSFSFTRANANFIGTVLTNNRFINTIITYTHGTDNGVGYIDGGWPPSFNSTLSGGLSGDAGVGANYDTLVSNITAYVDSYKSFNYYSNIDVILAPGYSEQVVQDKIINVCETRQDCFTFLETPDGLTPDDALTWAKGGGFGRTTEFDTYFGSGYYPPLKVKGSHFKSSTDNSIVSKLSDHSPIVRVAPTIINRWSNISRFSSPAGAIKGKLEDVEGVQYRLSPEEIKDLYADERAGKLNPINFSVEDGFYIDGQRTFQRKNAEGLYTALSRINVAQTALYLKKSIQSLNKFFYWEPGDASSWKTFGKLIEGLMKTMEDARAIEPQESQYGWTVTYDESVNTPNVTNNYGMIAVIEYYPIKSIEKIKVFSNIKEKDVTVTFSI